MIVNRIRKTIEINGMIEQGDRIGVAVSGGADSVALVRILNALAPEYGAVLTIVHLNHGLRGDESDRDEAFVKRLGEEMNISVISRCVSIPAIAKEKRGSLEDIARNERYRLFRELTHTQGLTKIALGHTMDDQVETVIMKFLRGSGLSGLRGMLPVRDGMYIRPLLEVSKKEILLYLEREGGDFVIDSTNENDAFLRNRIRNRLIPDLKSNYNSGLAESIGRMAHVIRMENDFIGAAVNRVFTELGISVLNLPVSIDLKKLESYHEALRWRVIKHLTDDFIEEGREAGYRHVQAVMKLLEGNEPNGICALPGGITARREYDHLVIERAGRDSDNLGGEGFSYVVSIPGVVTIREIGKTMSFEIVNTRKVDFSRGNTAYLDYHTLDLPLEVRSMKPGDRIEPLGMEGTKKVKALFIDAKIPRRRRCKIPLLVDRQSVLWVPEISFSRRVKITSKTEKVVKAEII